MQDINYTRHSTEESFFKRYTTLLSLNRVVENKVAKVWHIWNKYFKFHFWVQNSLEMNEMNAGSIHTVSRLLCPHPVFPHYK